MGPPTGVACGSRPLEGSLLFLQRRRGIARRGRRVSFAQMDISPLGRRERFAVEPTEAGEGIVVRASGALDLAAVATLKEALDGVFERDGHSTVILDLAQLTFIDSTGIALLLREKQAARRDGERLRIRGGSGRAVRRTLELAGVDSLLREG
jgi:anti-sigma B factor antagonist